MKRASALLAAVICVWCTWLRAPAHAELPEWLRKHNGDVDSGNDALVKGDAKGALESYNRAARKLPDAPGLQLDRGIALLKQGDYGKAREALLAATVPNATTDIRADAYHNLALSFYREADGLAGQNQHAEAQKLFREAVDASKRALHLRPSDPDTAWNLELAARRMREEQQKKKEEEEQKDKQKQDQKDKDQQQSQDQQGQGDQDEDQGQKQDQAQNPQEQKPDQDGKQANNQQDDQQKPEPDESQKDQAQQPKPDQAQNEPTPADQGKADEDQDQGQPQALPREAEQALDSLENNEENFERYRARQRANRARRAPEKDW